VLFIFSFKTTTATLCFSFALALGLQGDSCRRQSSPAPEASPSPQAKSTPRAKGEEGAKAKGSDVVVKTIETGEWGGARISLTVTKEGATVEYDCGNGTIDQRVELDIDGRFDVRGTHEDENGGSPSEISATDDEGKVSPADTSAKNRRPARYTGRVDGRTLSLTVTLTDDGSTFGKFVLTKGASARLNKCRG